MQMQSMLDSGMSVEDTSLFFGLSPQKLNYQLGMLKRATVFFNNKDI